MYTIMIKIKSGLWEIFDGKNFSAVVVFRYFKTIEFMCLNEAKKRSFFFNGYHVLTQHDILCTLH